MEYSKAEAKEWAHKTFHGVCNVIIPSYTHDLKRLNEKAIRHDVRRNIELGFWGALLVSEAGTTMPEMHQFMEVAVDEAKGRHRFLLHGPWHKFHIPHHRNPHDNYDWKPPLLAGLLAGYITYSYLHAGLHRHTGLKFLKTHHTFHHAHPQYNFGVTTTFWDRLFRTQGM